MADEIKRYQDKLLELQYNQVYDGLTFVNPRLQDSMRDYIRGLVEHKYRLELDDDLNLVLRDKNSPHLDAYDEKDRKLTLGQVLWKELDAYLKKS